VGGWRVDPSLDQISRDQEIIKLEPRTMRLLLRLIATPGEVVSSRELLDTVWAGVVVGPASVYQAISQLRKLLGDTDPTPTFIATVPRKGYRLVAPVQRAAEVAAEPSAAVVPTKSNSARRPYPYLMWGVLTLLIAAAGIVTWLTVGSSQRASMPASAATLDSRAIAIAPFEAATQDEATQMLAPIVSDLLRTRLAALPNLVVIANSSIVDAMQTERDPVAVARKVRARYLLQGEVSRARDEVLMNVTLVDILSGSQEWSITLERPVERLATIDEEVVRRTAQSLQIALDPASSSATADVPADLSTYQLYLRGQQLLSVFRAAEAEEATIVFSRVTTLAPSFARGYYSLAQALLLAGDLGAMELTEESAERVSQIIDRAIELNPALGAAWALRARLTSDPIQAEQFYRRALQLAPSYDENYIRYSDFLFSQRRRGEALELIDRARRIDPLSPSLCWRKAQLLLATRGDVAGMEKLLREALTLRADMPVALRDLAKSRYMWHGDFAEAIRLMERAAVVDPSSYWANGLTVEMYLEVGDLAAAMNVLGGPRQPANLVEREVSVAIPVYRRDNRAAAEIARSVLGEYLPPKTSIAVITDRMRLKAVHQELAGGYWTTANAVRDEAMATGDFAAALDLIERTTQQFSGASPMRNRGLVLTYAHMLLLSGETNRGRELLTSLLQHIDAEQIGRPAHTYALERAAAFALLGEDERALAELAAAQQAGRFAGWWYIAELDPIYTRVRPDPRFQALVARARVHSLQQRARLDEMRSKGDVPKRGST
jgi:DNA-binding winged helix-turn-helix (wHTH) protein/TolB-like protein/Tfp pilus assembly protein PilF